MHCLTLEDILKLHFQIIQDFGGSHGVRNEHRLQSVVEAPKQEIFGEEQYVGVIEKAAVYLRNIVGDHPFADGNKRTGITVAAVFMMRNGVRLTAKPKELEDFAVQVAVDHLDVATITRWLNDHTTQA